MKQFIFATSILLLIIPISTQVTYITGADYPEYEFTSCEHNVWNANNQLPFPPYECYYACHWDAANLIPGDPQEHGILRWDETRNAQLRLTDFPSATTGAYRLQVSMSLLRFVPGAGTPQWAAGDQLDVYVNGIHTIAEDITVPDDTFTCYGDLATVPLPIDFTVHQKDIQFEFDMDQLPLLQRQTIEVTVIPSLTNTGTYYGVARTLVEYAACHSDCHDCRDKQPTDCETCTTDPADLYLQGTNCETECFDTFYDDANRICQLCQQADCIHCDQADPTMCTECDRSTQQLYVQQDGSCALGCPDGQWEDGLVCTDCDPACLTCQPNGTSNDCLACNNNTFQPAALPGQCVPCDTGCTICVTTADNCTECDDGFFLDTAANSCVDEVATFCPMSTYPNSGSNVCEDCHEGCEECFDDTNQHCDSCRNNYYLHDIRICSPNCPVGFYGNGGSNECIQCNGNCKDCENSATDCSQCENGAYLNGTAPTRTCVTCDVACYQCYASGHTACVQCSVGYYLIQGTNTCVDNCDSANFPGFYADDNNNICAECDESCILCDGPYSTGCENNSCQPGYYYDNGTACKLCDDKCILCFNGGENECIECASGFFLDQHNSGSTCLRECPVGQWGDLPNKVCEFCVLPCTACTGGQQTDCTACRDQDFLIGTTCQACDLTCYTCEDEPTKCTECNVGRFLLNNECLTQCPQYYYGDTLSKQCKQCHYTCGACDGVAVDNCISCDNPRFLVGTVCKVCTDYAGRFTNQNQPPTTLDDCLEVCGDGVRPSTHIDCDDGNVEDGDGCSSSCQHEDGFTCTRETINSPDICYPDVASFFLNLENGQTIFPNNDANSNVNIVLSLDRELVIPNTHNIDEYIRVSIDGYTKEVAFNVIHSENDPKQIVLSVEIPHTLINRKINVWFINEGDFVTVVSNQSGSLQGSVVVEYYTYYTEQQRNSSSLYATVIRILMFFQMIFFICFVFTNYFPQVHLTMDVIQLLYIMRFNGTKYPLNGYEMFQQLNPVFEWYLPQILSYLAPEYINQDTHTSYFEYGIDALFWKNADQVLFASLCAFGIYIIMKFFTNETIWKLKNPRSRKAQRFFRHYMTIFFEWNFFVNVTYSAAIPIVYFGSLQLTQVDSQGIVIFSVFMLSLCGIWIFGTLSYYILISIKNRKALIYDDEEQDLVKRMNNTLFKSRIVWQYLDVFKPQAYLQVVFMLSRKIFFPIIVATSYSQRNTAQLPIMITINIFYFIYLVIINPIKRRSLLENWKLYVQELMHIVCYIPLFLLSDNENENTAQRFQWVEMFSIFTIVLLSTNVIYLISLFVIKPVVNKAWTQAPENKVVYYTQNMELPKTKENQDDANSWSDNNDNHALHDDEEEKETFNVAKRKILRNKFNLNPVQFKSSKNSKVQATTLNSQETRVHARGGAK